MATIDQRRAAAVWPSTVEAWLRCQGLISVGSNQELAIPDASTMTRTASMIAQVVGLLFVIVLPLSGAALPGVVLTVTNTNLPGEFVFLAGGFGSNVSNLASQCGIYTMNARNGEMHKIVQAPPGVFSSSEAGDLFCVRSGGDSYGSQTNMFVYLRDSGIEKTISVASLVQEVVAVDHHLFVKILTNTDERLIDFRLDDGSDRLIELPGASRWTHELFKNVHPAPQRANILHFEYSAFGERLEKGTDYEPGFYSLDVTTGDIKWFDKRDREGVALKAADGRFIWFQGKDAPFCGSVLIASPFSHIESELRDPKAQRASIIRKFSLLERGLAGTFCLEQMSPCRNYALIRSSAPIISRRGMSGWKNTYHAIDIRNGRSAAVVTDDTQRVTLGFISRILWVRGSADKAVDQLHP